MTTDEIERLARDKKPLPQYTTLPDECYYEAITSLWEKYRAGNIDRAEAHRRKMRLMRRHAEFKACYERCCAVYREQQDNIRNIGTYRTAIGRAEDVRERLRLAILAISAMTGDRVFEKYELKRLEEVQHGEN